MTVVTAEQMKQIETASLKYDLTWARLMENAGSAAATFIRRTMPPQGRNCMIFCGRGNNGGDGFVVARRLHENGANVLVVLVEGAPRSDEAAAMFAMLELMEIPVFSIDIDYDRIEACIEKADIIIDALYGTGFSGSLSGHAASACHFINSSVAAVVALDLPSGVACDSGDVAEGAVHADFTVAFDSLKPAHILRSCKEFCGSVEVVDIGIPPEAHEGIRYRFGAITEDMVWDNLPPRAADSHKGDFGRLLAICGSSRYRGAASLAVTAAMRSGLGLCSLAAPENVCASVAAHIPEATFLPLPTDIEGIADPVATIHLIREEMKRATAILFGCGLGDNHFTVKMLEYILKNARVPVILDADGINALAANIHLLQEARVPVTLTPHPTEMARLYKLSTEQVQADRERIAMRFAAQYRVNVVLKGHGTIVAVREGGFFVNPTGNPGLAKAGSGDLLAGILAAFIAQGIDSAEICAVYLHGLAGDLCAARRGEYSMLPSELLDDLCNIFSEGHGQMIS